MQLVVVSAVRAAVAAAMKMRRITSQTEFFFIYYLLSVFETNNIVFLLKLIPAII